MIDTSKYCFQKQSLKNSCVATCLSSAINYILDCPGDPFFSQAVIHIHYLLYICKTGNKEGFAFGKEYIGNFLSEEIEGVYASLSNENEQWDLIKEETSNGNPVLVSYEVLNSSGGSTGKSHINVALGIENDNLHLHEPGRGCEKVITKTEYDSEYKFDPRPLIIRRL